MKYIKTYEDNKAYYEFDAIKFYTDFNEIYDKEQNNLNSEFFDMLSKIVFNYKSIPMYNIMSKVISNILLYKRVNFYDLSGEIQDGIVRNCTFYHLDTLDDFKYSIDLHGSLVKYGYSEDVINFTDVDYSKPVKVYNNPTEIEKYIELYTNTAKYNL